jgi:hypothetical protein
MGDSANPPFEFDFWRQSLTGESGDTELRRAMTSKTQKLFGQNDIYDPRI